MIISRARSGLALALTLPCLLTMNLAAQGHPAMAGGASAYRGEQALPSQAIPLASFYKALFELEQGIRRDPVTIIQIGDSHTAGGMFSGRLRKLFQDRFGAAGRGTLPPGRPFRYYNPNQVKVSQSRGWKISNSLNSKTDGLFGLSGFRAESRQSNASMTLTAEQGAEFSLVEVEFVGQPGGGNMKISLDGQPVMTVSTRDTRTRARRVTYASPDGGHRLLKLSLVGDGPVTLLSWSVKRNAPGIIWDDHGIVGATINVTAKWNFEVVAWELTHLRPALIVVEYGGNEGYDDYLDLKEYEAIYRKRLALFKKAAPEASLLVLGPSDGNRMPDYCGGGSSKCSPLTEYERDNYLYLLRNKSSQLCRWHPPPNLDSVRKTQQRIANEDGYAFWDWLPIMDGECGMYHWVRMKPPLAANDYLHLTQQGYTASADTLFMDIIYYYDRYRAARLR